MSVKILVIGESCKDVFNYGNCDRLCPDAPVPVFNGTATTVSDGMAMNVLHNILINPIFIQSIGNGARWYFLKAL